MLIAQSKIYENENYSIYITKGIPPDIQEQNHAPDDIWGTAITDAFVGFCSNVRYEKNRYGSCR